VNKGININNTIEPFEFGRVSDGPAFPFLPFREHLLSDE